MGYLQEKGRIELNRLNMEGIVLVGLSHILTMDNRDVAYERYLKYLNLINYYKDKGYSMVYPMIEGVLDYKHKDNNNEIIRPNRLEYQLFKRMYDEWDELSLSNVARDAQGDYLYRNFYGHRQIGLAFIPPLSEKMIDSELTYLKNNHINYVTTHIFNKGGGLNVTDYKGYLTQKDVVLPTFLLEVTIEQGVCENVGLLNITHYHEAKRIKDLVGELHIKSKSYQEYLNTVNPNRVKKGKEKLPDMLIRVLYTPYPIQDNLDSYIGSKEGYELFIKVLQVSINDKINLTGFNKSNPQEYVNTLRSWLIS